METATGRLLLSSSVLVAKSAFRWYLTPFGKLARSGVLFAEKIP